MPVYNNDLRMAFIIYLCSIIQNTFEPPTCALVAYHLGRGGMPLHDPVGVNKKGHSFSFSIVFFSIVFWLFNGQVEDSTVGD